MLDVVSSQFYSQGSDAGLWCEVYSGSQSLNFRPALFLDRDGVIVEDTHYLGRAEHVHMLPGAAEAIGRCNRRGIPVVLVSNQSGIGRGFYDWSGFQAVQAALTDALAQAGARLDAVFACAHHADGEAPFNIADHPWRKPNPGMIVAAAERMKIRSCAFLDRRRPRLRSCGRPRRRACRWNSYCTTRDEAERAAAMELRGEHFAVDVASSLADAVTLLLAPGRLALTTSSSSAT